MCIAVSVVVLLLLLLCVLLCGVVPVQPQRCPRTAAAATAVAATGTGTGTRHVQIPTYLFEADMKQDIATHHAACPSARLDSPRREAQISFPLWRPHAAQRRKNRLTKNKKRKGKDKNENENENEAKNKQILC